MLLAKSLGDRKMELVERIKKLLRKAAKELKRSTRRLFMAWTVFALGEGGK